MRYRLSPFRHAFESLLDLFGLGPRRSSFSPARSTESRVRFAHYVSRLQPAAEPVAARRTARLLSQGGAVSRGNVRHAPLAEVPPPRRPLFHLFTLPGGVAARRRAQAQQPETALRTLFNGLRAR